ncbi:hypothetical protein KI387_016333, partial [Taxus chinensis]
MPLCRRHAASTSASEGSGEHKVLEDGDEEVEQVRESSEQGDGHNVLHSTENMHDVFGDSDEEEPQEYAGHPDKINIVRVSNIMGIEPNPFDPKSFVEEAVFITDESRAKKCIRLEDNVVRLRE